MIDPEVRWSMERGVGVGGMREGRKEHIEGIHMRMGWIVHRRMARAQAARRRIAR